MNQNTNFTPRSLVMELSVKHEAAVNTVLATLLGIKPTESRSFGTSSHALNFNSKINLLMDLNFLDKIQREKFQIFMEVRNKFAHIYSVDSFQKCFALTNGFPRLKKIVINDAVEGDVEAEMQIVFCALSVEMSEILIKISNTILGRIYK